MSDEQKLGSGESNAIEVGLRAEQRSALEVLVSGKSISETARSAGVTRATVYRWLKSDPAFRAAYNQWHEEMEESARSRMLMLTEKASGALEKALEDGDAKSALVLLKGMGIIRPGGERLTEAADIKQRAELDQKKRRMGMMEESRKIDSTAKQSRAFDREIEEMFEKPKRGGG